MSSVRAAQWRGEILLAMKVRDVSRAKTPARPKTAAGRGVSAAATKDWGTGAMVAGCVGLGLLVACALSTNGLLRWRLPGAQLIATLAYSLYLTSKEVIHLVDDWFPKIAEGHMLAWLVVYSACSLIVATVLYWCVEKPFLMLRDRRQGLWTRQG